MTEQCVVFDALTVPALPSCFVSRPAELAQLKETVLNAAPGPITLTGSAEAGQQFGPDGIGKSTLAAALAQDVEVQQAFPGGVFWLPLGPRPALTLLQSRLARQWTGRPHAFVDAQTGLARLSELAASRACLLVLDDVRRLEDVEAFALLEPSLRLLVVTRDVGRIAALGVEEVRLKPLDEASSLALLAAWAGQPVDTLPVEAAEVARLCAGLPLSLALAGGMISGGTTGWDVLPVRLQQVDLPRLRVQMPFEPYLDALRAIAAAFDDLPAPLRARCIDLAVFPPLAAIPEQTLISWWVAEGLDETAARDALRALAGRAWILPADGPAWQVHPLVGEYVRRYVPNFPELHARLLAAHRAALPARPLRKGLSAWAVLPAATPYLWTRLAHHLIEARQSDALWQLVFDFNWLQARLAQGDLDLLLDDYALLAPDAAAAQVRQALQDAAPVLLADPEQLPAQLSGRLLDSSLPNVRDLMRQITHWRGRPWLRPLRASLPPPGGLHERKIDLDGAPVRALDVTPDGRHVFVGATDGRLALWDLDLGFLVRAWGGHRAAVNGVAVLPDGQHALSAADDGMLKMWALETGTEVAVLQGHTYGVNGVAALPDGRRAVSASADGTIKVWDVSPDGPARRREQSTLKGHGGPVWAVAALADGRILSGGSDGTVRLWDAAQGIELQAWAKHSGEVYAVAATPDGRRAVSASMDETVRVWDIEQGRLLHTLKGHGRPVRDVSVTPDGLWAISAADDCALIVWDLERGVKRSELSGHEAAVRALAMTWQGRAVSAADDRTLRVWRVESDLHTLNGHRDAVRDIAILPDGRSYLTVSDDRLIKLWGLDWRRGPLRVLDGHRHDVNALALFERGRRAVTASRDRTLKVWDLESGQEIHTLSGHAAPVKAVVVLAGDVQAVSGGSDGALKVWDLRLGREVGVLGRHAQGITAIAALDGKQVLVASEDGALRVWDVAAAEAYTLCESGPSIWALTAGDPSLAVSGSIGGDLIVWDMARRVVARVWRGHGGQITTLALTADRQRLVSCSVDRTLCVWDMARGQPIARFTAEGPLLSCAVGPDRNTIIAGEKSGRVHALFLQEG